LETKDVKKTWKPLLNHCSALLRRLKMETTNSRLNRLSDMWSKSELGTEQASRLKDAVLHACNSEEKASGDCKVIIDGIELQSVPDSPQQGENQ
ncbi:hypothetical protein PMAYCL1PPCAC_03193, partial [Pristionchus mayeri]